MDLKVEIDSRSGFCGGVIRAINGAERFLEENPGKTLYSLGSIVHNEAELNRLKSKGLATIDKEGLPRLKDREGMTLLIRAHGEPPETYSLADNLGIRVIDCTCPVVLKLQKSIRAAYDRLLPKEGKVLIFGKVGHAEVLGLLGQVGGDALVIENMEMLKAAVKGGRVRTDRPIEIFSQTTKSPVEYAELCDELSRRMTAELKVHNTICSQVASRHEQLADFAVSHDVIIFVSGASSSNGKVLYELCLSKNSRTYHITEASELDPAWFRDGDKVGICGATSTPGWLLKEVHEAVSGL